MEIINNDNIYPIGTKIVAKQDPTTPLLIQQYCQRIYYCQIEGQPERKLLAYFERELIAPKAN
jgi:hypothetical protein